MDGATLEKVIWIQINIPISLAKLLKNPVCAPFITTNPWVREEYDPTENREKFHAAS